MLVSPSILIPTNHRVRRISCMVTSTCLMIALIQLQPHLRSQILFFQYYLAHTTMSGKELHSFILRYLYETSLCCDDFWHTYTLINFL